MEIFTLSFKLTLLLAMFAEDPADLTTPFVESCQPEAKQSLVEGYDDIFPEEFDELKPFFLNFVDPVASISAIHMCSCFEDAYSHVDGPLKYPEMWEMVQQFANGNLNRVREIRQPLADASEQVQADYSSQTQRSGILMKLCLDDRVQSMRELGAMPYLIAAKIGIIRY